MSWWFETSLEAVRYTAAMQVTLTPHAAQLLREALARDPRLAPEQIIEEALAERLGHYDPAQADPVWQKLKTMPGLHLPDHWPPQFAQMEPLHVEGESVSEQLVRERR